MRFQETYFDPLGDIFSEITNYTQLEGS